MDQSNDGIPTKVKQVSFNLDNNQNIPIVSPVVAVTQTPQTTQITQDVEIVVDNPNFLPGNNVFDYFSIFGFNFSKSTVYLFFLFVFIIIFYYVYSYVMYKPSKKKRQEETTFTEQERISKDNSRTTEEKH